MAVGDLPGELAVVAVVRRAGAFDPRDAVGAHDVDLVPLAGAEEPELVAENRPPEGRTCVVVVVDGVRARRIPEAVGIEFRLVEFDVRTGEGVVRPVAPGRAVETVGPGLRDHVVDVARRAAVLRPGPEALERGLLHDLRVDQPAQPAALGGRQVEAVDVPLLGRDVAAVRSEQGVSLVGRAHGRSHRDDVGEVVARGKGLDELGVVVDGHGRADHVHQRSRGGHGQAFRDGLQRHPDLHGGHGVDGHPDIRDLLRLEAREGGRQRVAADRQGTVPEAALRVGRRDALGPRNRVPGELHRRARQRHALRIGDLALDRAVDLGQPAGGRQQKHPENEPFPCRRHLWPLLPASIS